MKYYNDNDIKKLNITSKCCIKWVYEALKLKENSFLPTKCSIKPTDNIFFTSMPCLIPELDVYGLKMVCRIPGNKTSLNSHIMLYKYSTGELLCVLDCNWITSMRTGAVAVMSIDKLARSNFMSIGCIGLGNICKVTLKILIDSYTNKKIELILYKYNDEEQKIIDKFKGFSNISIKVESDINKLVSMSDIVISSVTSTSNNFADNESYRKGITVIPIHTKGFQNCDLFFDKFIIDDYEHTKSFKHFNEFKEVLELKDLSNMISGRDNDEQRIIAYNVGIALFDVYFAYKIYQLLIKSD